MNLILLRHGESQWNKLNKFTGWTDVDLTENGISEAKWSGKQILKEKLKIHTIYTSLLIRAQHTSNIVSKIINFDSGKIHNDWRLNERHYGSLQGLNKSETAQKYGEEQVHIWRRSYDIPPPKLELDDKRHPRFVDKFKKINSSLPSGESLKDVIIRLHPFWNEYFELIKNQKGDHLIVAHSNSLRAIVKILDKLSNDEIMSINIPTGIPLVYSFDSKFEVVNKKYLADEKTVLRQEEIIKKQGKKNG